MTTLDYLPWQRPQEYADRPCVRDADHELTYAEFGTWVEAVAEQFREYGVTQGAVVAIMLPNRVELLVAMVAAWRLGATATPVNPVFTANEADYQIADADADLVVTAGPEAPTGGRPSLTLDQLRRSSQPGEPLPAAVVSPEDTALLIYTSGSTGRPKGVVLSHGNIGAMAAMMAEYVGIGGEDHCLLVLPLFHVNAICVSFLAPMLVGGQLSIQARFHPTRFLTAIEPLRPTYFSAVPTIYAHLVSLPADVQADTSSVRFAICGAAPASQELLEATEKRFGFPLVEGYGLTEGTCEVAVIGAPHEMYGEVPVAYVAPYPDADIVVDALLERCRTQLTKVKVPVAIHLVDALPKNAVGKVDKPTLRARGNHLPTPTPVTTATTATTATTGA